MPSNNAKSKKYNFHWLSQALNNVQEPIIKTRKIDSRNSLHGVMMYQIKLDYKEAEKFWICFEWCCNTWGTPVEYRSVAVCGEKLNKTIWTYRVPGEMYNSFEIYFRGDEELMLFQLRWQDA